MAPMDLKLTPSRIAVLAVCIIALTALLLLLMGRVPICQCGYVKLWHGVTFSSENSQHLTDWYSYSHIIHGLVFYFLLWLVPGTRKLSVGVGFLLGLFIESAWEVFENTDFVINRYRAVTISLDYYGDSVINSVADILFMVLGFLAAYKLPVWVVTALAIFLELFVLYFIRDNLALNIIMLIYPFQSIMEWQGGG